MITRDTVREIVQNEIYKYHRTFYSRSDEKTVISDLHYANKNL